jgi:hypothetical protein
LTTDTVILMSTTSPSTATRLTITTTTATTPTTTTPTTTTTTATESVNEIGDHDIIYRFYDRSMYALCQLFPQLYGKIPSLCAPQEEE